MHVRRNSVARSRNHCCRGKTKMHSVYVVELRFTVPYLYIQILGSAQQCSYNIFVVSNDKT